MHHTVEIFKD